MISEGPARFPKRLLKPLGLRVSCYWAKCPTSDCDQHALCRLQVAPLYCSIPPAKHPGFVLAKISVGNTAAWSNPTAHWDFLCEHLSVLHTLRLTPRAILKELIHSHVSTPNFESTNCVLCVCVLQDMLAHASAATRKTGKTKTTGCFAHALESAMNPAWVCVKVFS